MDPEAVSFAEKALLDGAMPMKVQKRLLMEYGINVKPKLLQNLKQNMITVIKYNLSFNNSGTLLNMFICLRFRRR